VIVVREAVRPDLHLGRHRAPGPAATGRRERRGGHDWVVYSRTLRAPVDDVWDALTDRERVGVWVGSPRESVVGDPDGFSFRFEAVTTPALHFRVDDLVERRRIALSMQDAGDSGGAGAWRLVIEVAAHEDGTTVRLAQAVVNPALAPSVAAGCEFYLDRLRTHLEGGDVRDLDYDEYFVGQASHYRMLFPVQRRG
jgi:uncharacterized protein YndB with AHSA1/START domain